MANNYAQASEMLEIPPEKLERAEEIMNRLSAGYEEDDDYGQTPFDWFVHEAGIWFSHDESLDLDAVERCVSTLQAELELDEPFVMEAAFTCSKPRIGEFGGAAFRAQRGQPTVWLNTGDLRSWKPDRLRTGLKQALERARALAEKSELLDESELSRDLIELGIWELVRELEALAETTGENA